MKKIFTLFTLMAAAISSYAAAPELLFGDTPVEPGKVYETAYTVQVLQLGPKTIHIYKQDSDLFIRAEADKNITVEVTSSHSVQFCSVDGQCINTVAGEMATKSGVWGIGQTGMYTEDAQIHNGLQDMTGKPASEVLNNITVEVKAYYTASPAEYTTAKVIMTNKSELGAIGNIDADKASVTVKGNKLAYNFSSPTPLAVYSIAGGRVYGNTLNGQGEVSLDFLHPGVYIYTTGKTSGKILLRK